MVKLTKSAFHRGAAHLKPLMVTDYSQGMPLTSVLINKGEPITCAYFFKGRKISIEELDTLVAQKIIGDNPAPIHSNYTASNRDPKKGVNGGAWPLIGAGA